MEQNNIEKHWERKIQLANGWSVSIGYVAEDKDNKGCFDYITSDGFRITERVMRMSLHQMSEIISCFGIPQTGAWIRNDEIDGYVREVQYLYNQDDSTEIHVLITHDDWRL